MRSKGQHPAFILKNGTVAGAATVGAGLLAAKRWRSARKLARTAHQSPRGDVAILSGSLQALEQVEEDLWRQYAELAVPRITISGLTGGNAAYSQALQLLDGDMPQYIHDIPMTRSATPGFLPITWNPRARGR